MGKKRKPNIFETILLLMGIALIVIGYVAIHRMASIDGGISWGLLQTTFLWILIILVVILAAVNENMKEELKIVIQNQAEELKLLRKDLKKR
jgi:surface polysaccharide O-acyltransferase-like enzyme